MQDSVGKGDDWIKLHTKPCPKCKSPIEKNSGCMHMTCSNCDHHFCWLCMGSQADHRLQGDHFMCNENTLAKTEAEMRKKGKKV